MEGGTAGEGERGGDEGGDRGGAHPKPALLPFADKREPQTTPDELGGGLHGSPTSPGPKVTRRTDSLNMRSS